MADTPNIGIRLIRETDVVSHEQINAMFETVDTAMGLTGNVREVMRFDTTVYIAGWVEQDEQAVYDIVQAGVNESHDVDVYVAPDQAGRVALLDRCVPGVGRITLLANKVPLEDIGVTVRVWEVLR